MTCGRMVALDCGRLIFLDCGCMIFRLRTSAYGTRHFSWPYPWLFAVECSMDAFGRPLVRSASSYSPETLPSPPLGYGFRHLLLHSSLASRTPESAKTSTWPISSLSHVHVSTLLRCTSWPVALALAMHAFFLRAFLRCRLRCSVRLLGIVERTPDILSRKC